MLDRCLGDSDPLAVGDGPRRDAGRHYRVGAAAKSRTTARSRGSHCSEAPAQPHSTTRRAPLTLPGAGRRPGEGGVTAEGGASTEWCTTLLEHCLLPDMNYELAYDT